MAPEWFEDYQMKEDLEIIISSVLNVTKSSVNVTRNLNPNKFLRLWRQINGLTSLIVLISTNEKEKVLKIITSDEFKQDLNLEISNYKFEGSNLNKIIIQTVKPMDGNQKLIYILLNKNIENGLNEFASIYIQYIFT